MNVAVKRRKLLFRSGAIFPAHGSLICNISIYYDLNEASSILKFWYNYINDLKSQVIVGKKI